MRDRHAACVLQVAESGAVTRLGVRYPGDTALVRLEHANFLAALRWLHEQDKTSRRPRPLSGAERVLAGPGLAAGSDCPR